jgi:hypothetical protein
VLPPWCSSPSSPLALGPNLAQGSLSGPLSMETFSALMSGFCRRAHAQEPGVGLVGGRSAPIGVLPGVDGR